MRVALAIWIYVCICVRVCMCKRTLVNKCGWVILLRIVLLKIGGTKSKLVLRMFRVTDNFCRVLTWDYIYLHWRLRYIKYNYFHILFGISLERCVTNGFKYIGFSLCLYMYYVRVTIVLMIHSILPIISLKCQ